MSLETARKFLDLLAGDETLQTQFLIAAPADITEVLRFASAKGFSFSALDLREALGESSQDTVIQEMGETLIPSSPVGGFSTFDSI